MLFLMILIIMLDGVFILGRLLYTKPCDFWFGFCANVVLWVTSIRRQRGNWERNCCCCWESCEHKSPKVGSKDWEMHRREKVSWWSKHLSTRLHAKAKSEYFFKKAKSEC